MQSNFPQDRLLRLEELLAAPRRIAIITHHNPDGDAIGSSLGFHRILSKFGHDPVVVLPNAPPDFLRWMPGYMGTVDQEARRQVAGEVIRDADIVFALDFNRLDRVKDLQAALAAKPVVLIDHHQDPAQGFALMFSDPSASATAQLVVDLSDAMGWEGAIDAAAATCLYAGLMTDTGSFRFNNVNAHTFRTAARLVELGAEPHRVYDQVMDENTEQRLKLLGFTLSERMRVIRAHDTVIIHLSAADLKRFGHQPGDTEGLVNYGLSIGGMRLSAFFMERPDGVKISLRSKGNLPVHLLARDHFEGGGHPNAAGGRSAIPLEATIERFEKLLPVFMAAHSA